LVQVTKFNKRNKNIDMSRKTENKKYIAKKQLNRQSIAFRLDHMTF